VRSLFIGFAILRLNWGHLTLKKSKTLFLLICSGTKDNLLIGTTYEEKNSIIQSLPNNSNQLLDGREKSFNIIKDPKTLYRGKISGTYDWNANLVKGRDLNGKEEAKYVEAINLYTGRFYQGLGEQGKKNLLNSEHHFLIISGLYGLASLRENIQLYECPLEDIYEFQNVWTSNERITNILLDYINYHGIENVIDLTAQNEYRNLLKWSQMKNRGDLSIFHVHCKLFAGHESLKYLGNFLSSTLINYTDENFSKIKDTMMGDNCCLSRSRFPPEDWPMEESERIEKIIQGKNIESKELEFKSGLTGKTRDPLDNQYDKLTYNEIKYRCMKSIASMMNTEGGDIFIGISDNKSVIGISEELLQFKNKSNKEDFYLQIFDQMVTEYLGKLYHSYVNATFLTYDRKLILHIKITKSKEPVCLYIDEDGNKIGEFWIRGEVSNRKLNSTQQRNYINRHFGIPYKYIKTCTPKNF